VSDPFKRKDGETAGDYLKRMHASQDRTLKGQAMISKVFDMLLTAAVLCISAAWLWAIVHTLTGSAT
jgi:hypothetical protein